VINGTKVSLIVLYLYNTFDIKALKVSFIINYRN